MASSAPRFSIWRLIFALFGLLVMVLGLAWALNAYNFERTGQKAQAKVVANDANSNDVYQPLVMFRDETGTIRMARTNIASSSYDWRPGDVVEVTYNFQFSDQVRVPDLFNSWIPGLVAALVGFWIMRRAGSGRKAATAPAGPAPAETAGSQPGPGANAAAPARLADHHSDGPGTTAANAERSVPRKPASPNKPAVTRMR
jgi:hypothetical protein